MKIGLALGGGGAKGLAHLGAVRVLREAGVSFDIITGTSIGALVGAVLASGNIAHLEREVRDIKLTDIPLLLSPAWSLSGFFSGKTALDVLSELLEAKLIEELPIPFAALSVDISTAKLVVHTRGDLRRAIRASFSIPAVFTPVIEGEQVLVDGGLLEPVPIETARALGADKVIAIDLFGRQSPFHRQKKVPSGIQSALTYLRGVSEKLPWGERSTEDRAVVPNIIDILERTLAVNQRELTKLRLRDHPADLLIQPDLGDIGLLDYHRAEPIIERGVEAAKSMLPEIEKLLKGI